MRGHGSSTGSVSPSLGGAESSPLAGSPSARAGSSGRRQRRRPHFTAGSSRWRRRRSPRPGRDRRAPPAGCALTVDARDLPTGSPLDDFTLHRQRRQLEAADRPAGRQHGEQQQDRRRGRPGPHHGQRAGRAVPDLGALARPQDVGQAHHPPEAVDRRRLADRTDRPDGAERRPPAAAREDPRLRLRGQRVGERRSRHRGGRASRASRSASRSRRTAPSPSTTTTTRSAAAPA